MNASLTSSVSSLCGLKDGQTAGGKKKNGVSQIHLSVIFCTLVILGMQKYCAKCSTFSLKLLSMNLFSHFVENTTVCIVLVLSMIRQ